MGEVASRQQASGIKQQCCQITASFFLFFYWTGTGRCVHGALTEDSRAQACAVTPPATKHALRVALRPTCATSHAGSGTTSQMYGQQAGAVLPVPSFCAATAARSKASL